RARQLVACDRGFDQRGDRREAGARFGRRRRGLRGKATGRREDDQSDRSGASLHGIQYILKALRGDSSMRQRLHLTRGVLAAVLVAALAASAAAQTGRVGGTVKDESGQPIKGATITADNPNASPSSFTATTDDKGRFSMIGLRSGQWAFSARAPGSGPETL